MLKKLIKSIAYKLYKFGKQEDRRIFLEARENLLKNAVTIGKSSWIYEKSEIENFQNDNTKIVIGNGTWIKGDLLIFPYGGSIKIGDNCFVGPGTRIWSGDKIEMGDNVLIAHDVNILDFSHERNHVDRGEGFRSLVKEGHPKEKGKIPTKAIIIEDDVAIYAGAHIIMGVTIGKGSVISGGAVVLKDVPSFSLVMGNPGKVVWKIKSS